MFRINIPILKAFEKNGKTYIRGVASDSSLDLHEERMSDDCLKNFEESVNRGDIPLRADHSVSWRQVLGRLTKACLGKSSSKPLEVEAMVDESMSGGKDLVAALNSGAVLGLSVAGRVAKMSYEWSDSLKKQIRVYEDIILEEISVVSNPANPRTSVSIAKSLDTKPGKSVGKAEVLDSKAGMSVKKGMVPSRILTELLVSKEKSLDEILDAIKKSEPLSKIDHSPSYSDDPHGVSIVSNGDNSGGDFITTDGDPSTEMGGGIAVNAELSSEDFLRLLYIMRVLNDVGPMEPVEPPEKLFDWNYQQTLREECFVMMEGGDSVMPHHNPDYTLDEELVKFYMAALVNGQAWSVMCCIEDYCTALSHIYYHFKELSMPKLEAKSLKLKKDAVVEPEIIEEVAEPTPVETEPVVAEVVAEVTPEEVKEEVAEVVAEVVEGGTPEAVEAVAEEVPVQAEEAVDGELVEKALTLKDLLPILKEIKAEIDAIKVAKASVEVTVADAPVVEKALEVANESMESLKKELADTKELATKAFLLVEKVASQPRGRQSVAYSTVEKSNEAAEVVTNPTEKMAVLMKNGMSFTQAYSQVNSEIKQ